MTAETAARATNEGAEPSSRERILGAAWTLFASDGYAEVSMQQIADAAKINKATLYHHFADKEELFAAVIAADFSRLRAAIERSVNAERSFRDHLVAVADLLFARSRSDSLRLMTLMHQHATIMQRHKAHMQSAPPWEPLRPLFERTRAQGAIRDLDLDLLMTSFFGMVIFQAQRARFVGCDAADEQLARDLADLFMSGISPR